jgi:hypothetical protein
VDETKQQRIDTPEKLVDWMQKNLGFGNEVNIKRWACNGPDKWWWEREAFRIKRGRIVPMWTQHSVFTDPPISKFFVYVSSLDPKKIGYTPTPEHGRRDIQVVSTVGRFLTRFYKDQLTEDQIRVVANHHRVLYGEPCVHFAFGADEIEYAYEHGPTSCMIKKRWSYEPPMRVYDGPDTALACIKTSENEITARTVIRIDTNPMEYTRIYGDGNLLEPRLKDLGFVFGSLDQVRLRREKAGSDLVCPFIDGCEEANGDGEFLVIGCGDLDCQNTNGLADVHEDEDVDEDDGEWCDGCETSGHDEEDMYCTFNDDYRCNDCVDNDYVMAVVNRRGQEVYVDKDDAILVRDQWYLDDNEVLEDNGLRYCNSVSEWLPEDEVTYAEDEYYPCDDCCKAVGRDDYWLKENCRQDQDNEWVHKDDAIELDGVYFHPNHPPDDAELVDGEWRVTEAA